MRWRNHSRAKLCGRLWNVSVSARPLSKPPFENTNERARSARLILCQTNFLCFIYELCVKIFSFCNEQLTDGNSLTWCKCKIKRNNLRTAKKTTTSTITTVTPLGKWSVSHRPRLLYSRGVRVWVWKRVLFKVSKNHVGKKLTLNCVYCLVLWLLFTSFTNSTCNK